VLVRLEGVTRSGERRTYGAGYAPVEFTYRHTDLPDDFIVTRLVLAASGAGDAAEITGAIDALQARRAETQPIKEKTSGSTFANPDPPGTPDQRSAWKLIDAAGCLPCRPH
jgi:UDP-N-acetylmuramate dehydrogenase